MMTLKTKLVIIGILSIIGTMIIFLTQKPSPNTGVFNTVFGLLIMVVLMFICIAINFFAISFLLKKIIAFFR